jgi:CDP-diacylglycerol--glycerol-3-phosphate 3-phosphatidyltransferase
MWLTDILDGYFARRRNEVSELGKIIDPVADKVSIVTITLVMVLTDIIPLWFFLVIMSRDILILSGGMVVKRKTGKVLQSNIIGKLAVFIIGFTLINMLIITHFLSQSTSNFFLYHIEKLELYWEFLILISMMMIVISIVSYFRKFLKAVIK